MIPRGLRLLCTLVRAAASKGLTLANVTVGGEVSVKRKK